MYYVYQNWRARGLRARIHKGKCRFCNDGMGQGQGFDPKNAQWHGPFETEEIAKMKADSLGSGYDIKSCTCCRERT
jgi:hypothetical protein